MTDEELGRAWAGRHGRNPYRVGLWDRDGENWIWLHYGRTYYRSDCSVLPAAVLSELPQTPDWSQNGYRTEADAYAALGAALRNLVAFADGVREVMG